MMKLTVQHLSCVISGREILHDISFSAEGKTLTGIIGPNGCGKSTLLAHISHRLPSKNAIFLDSRAAESIDRRTYARTVAVMAQQREEPSPSLLAEDVVLMGRYPYKERFQDYTAHDRNVAMAMMKKTGAAPLIGKAIGAMSGGERQRVWIAKTLAQEPELLLLDEPTNHLDVKYKIALMEELRHFEGTAVIVLHDLSLALRYCDQVLLMKEGHLLAAGKTETLMTPENLKTLFDVPFYTACHDRRHYIYY